MRLAKKATSQTKLWILHQICTLSLLISLKPLYKYQTSALGHKKQVSSKQQINSQRESNLKDREFIIAMRTLLWKKVEMIKMMKMRMMRLINSKKTALLQGRDLQECCLHCQAMQGRERERRMIIKKMVRSMNHQKRDLEYD